MTRESNDEEVAARTLMQRLWAAVDPRRVDSETWVQLAADAAKVIATFVVVVFFVMVGNAIISLTAGDNTTITVEMVGGFGGLAVIVLFLGYILRMVFTGRSLFGRLGRKRYASASVGVATLAPMARMRIRQPGDPVSPYRDDRALHEASHAIAVLELGHTLIEASIKTDYETGSGGYVKSILSGAGQGDGDPRPPVLDDLVISLAGPLAQKTPHDTRIGSIDDDYIRAVRGAVMHSVAFPDAGSINDILDRATVRAREIVETRRDDIRLVADALLDRETLTGDETIAIIERGSIHADA